MLMLSHEFEIAGVQAGSVDACQRYHIRRILIRGNHGVCPDLRNIGAKVCKHDLSQHDVIVRWAKVRNRV
jgi:hypothetical protein